MADEIPERSKYTYAELNGHCWTVDLGQVLIDEYKPFLDLGFELDSLGKHFLGGQGFAAGGIVISVAGQRT